MSVKIEISDHKALDYVICDNCGTEWYNNTTFNINNMIPPKWIIQEVKESGFYVRKHFCTTCKDLLDTE